MQYFDVGDDVYYFSDSDVIKSAVKISYAKFILTEEHELIPKKLCYKTKEEIENGINQPTT